MELYGLTSLVTCLEDVNTDVVEEMVKAIQSPEFQKLMLNEHGVPALVRSPCICALV